ncbi:MAG TPA: MXAN_5187 C-terminal domain-containing protein [Thermoanaerobaculia bacterium]|nr:MXAN_5187 C-terminal domain-containing protein [Thermoanaerobaculia bacterium]
MRPAAGARPPAASPAQAARAAEAELEQRFERVDRRIQELKVLYNRYFAGDPKVPVPPDGLRAEIDGEMRRLRTINMRRSVDNFRLGSLEAQLSSYSEMFKRRVRNIEEGKVKPRHSTPPPPASGYDVDAGVVVDSHCEPEAVEALFQGLVKRNPSATMDLDTFRGYLEKQVTQIRGKTGCAAVQFRVVAEGGKVKLKAKPVGAAGGES